MQSARSVYGYTTKRLAVHHLIMRTLLLFRCSKCGISQHSTTVYRVRELPCAPGLYDCEGFERRNVLLQWRVYWMLLGGYCVVLCGKKIRVTVVAILPITSNGI
jgi:hypothetical protein